MAWRDEDWKELLSRDSQKVLADLLEEASDHKGAYLNADDVKVAQIWAALIELKKDFDILKARVDMSSEPWKLMVAGAEEEKRRALERMVRDIIKPTEPGQEEATRKLVDSLMKF